MLNQHFQTGISKHYVYSTLWLEPPAVPGRLEGMGYIKMINDLDARIAASKVGLLRWPVFLLAWAFC